MATRNRIPTILEPYLRLPPEHSLILLTGTLGCSINWLTARFVGSLTQNAQHGVGSEVEKEEDTAVVLVSWMRNEAFWKSELRRAAGVDTVKLGANGRYAFVDCFTTLSSVVPEKVVAEMESKITACIHNLQKRPIALILDSPDILLALDLAQANQLCSMFLRLRAQAYSTVMACSADSPLLAAASSSSEQKTFTPIELETAAFVAQQAHLARFVISVRELDTGAARDVSGVLRVTRGGCAYSWDNDGDLDDAERVKEMEALYLVLRDGNAKVFERGATGS